MMGNKEVGYEGIAIDIFEKTKQLLLKEGVSLDLDYVEASSYGMMQNNSWTGALGDLIDSKVGDSNSGWPDTSHLHSS